MAKVTITIEDLSQDEASISVDFGEGGYNEESGAHRLGFMLSTMPERTGPVEDLLHPDDSEGGTHD